MEKRKGMSPLIAAVILIAATMSIAAILAFWASGFMKERLGEIRSEELGITGGAKCLEAEFELHSGSLDAGSGTLKLILNNKKAVDLTLTNLFLIAPDNTVETITLNETLGGNEIIGIEKTITKTDFLTGEVKTHCPDVSVFFTSDQVSS